MPASLVRPRPLVSLAEPEPRPEPPFRIGPLRAGGALALNAAVWPGLGSLLVGEQVGWAQGLLFLAGLALVVLGLGLLPMLAAWGWSLATAARILVRASRGRAYVTS